MRPIDIRIKRMENLDFYIKHLDRIKDMIKRADNIQAQGALFNTARHYQDKIKQLKKELGYE